MTRARCSRLALSEIENKQGKLDRTRPSAPWSRSIYLLNKPINFTDNAYALIDAWRGRVAGHHLPTIQQLTKMMACT